MYCLISFRAVLVASISFRTVFLESKRDDFKWSLIIVMLMFFFSISTILSCYRQFILTNMNFLNDFQLALDAVCLFLFGMLCRCWHGRLRGKGSKLSLIEYNCSSHMSFIAIMLFVCLMRVILIVCRHNEYNWEYLVAVELSSLTILNGNTLSYNSIFKQHYYLNQAR